jgi:hypothetical protein
MVERMIIHPGSTGQQKRYRRQEVSYSAVFEEIQ